MIHNKKILLRIKQLVHLTEPSATVILYGSYARGESTKQSDIGLSSRVLGTKVQGQNVRLSKKKETGPVQLADGLRLPHPLGTRVSLLPFVLKVNRTFQNQVRIMRFPKHLGWKHFA